MSFIGFGSLKMKLQSFSGDVSIWKVCELDTNDDIKFYKCSGKKLLPNVDQKMFLDISSKLVKRSVVHGCLFTYHSTKDLYHGKKLIQA